MPCGLYWVRAAILAFLPETGPGLRLEQFGDQFGDWGWYLEQFGDGTMSVGQVMSALEPFLPRLQVGVLLGPVPWRVATISVRPLSRCLVILLSAGHWTIMCGSDQWISVHMDICHLQLRDAGALAAVPPGATTPGTEPRPL